MDRMADLYEIQKLKARYFRLVDTRQFDALADVLTEDMTFYSEPGPQLQPGARPTFDGRRAFIDSLKRSNPGRVTVHHGHMPEIEFTGPDTATGIWSMFDWVDDPSESSPWQGFGHYHEHYVREADGRWRIRESHLTRLRVDRVDSRKPLRDDA